MVVGYYVCDQPGVVVDDDIYGHIVVMEIIITWLWLVGIVAFLVLVGYLFRDRRNKRFSRGSYCLKVRLLPDHMELFQQRRRKRHSIFKHFSRHR